MPSVENRVTECVGIADVDWERERSQFEKAKFVERRLRKCGQIRDWLKKIWRGLMNLLEMVEKREQWIWRENIFSAEFFAVKLFDFFPLQMFYKSKNPHPYRYTYNVY